MVSFPAAAGDHRGQRRTSAPSSTATTVPQAGYEITNYIVGVEQLTTTTCNVVGDMTLERTLTSRDESTPSARILSVRATGRFRVCGWQQMGCEASIPPPSIQASMEKQMKADREEAGDTDHRIPGRTMAPLGGGKSGAQILAPRPPKQVRSWLLRARSAVS